jgi:DNA-3-methyladenine glycosylase
MNINDFLHLQIPISFYNRNEVWKIAKELIGKILVTHFNDELTVGRIIETEAYNGIYDKASHSYNGKRTSRNEIMYSTAGVSYVYICYGVHHLLNVVTNKENIPDAVLIRAIEPIVGFDIMTKNHSGISLTHHLQFLCDDGFKYKESEIISSPRIGVESAGKDALLPYRFFVKNNKYVSGKKNF